MTFAGPLTNPTCQDLGRVIGNAGRILQALDGVVRQLETHVLGDIAGLHATQVNRKTLQSIDLLSQTLTELGGVLEQLETTVPSQIPVNASDVIGMVRLEHLRAQLLADDGGKVGPLPAGQGDIAMF